MLVVMKKRVECAELTRDCMWLDLHPVNASVSTVDRLRPSANPVPCWVSALLTSEPHALGEAIFTKVVQEKASRQGPGVPRRSWRVRMSPSWSSGWVVTRMP